LAINDPTAAAGALWSFVHGYVTLELAAAAPGKEFRRSPAPRSRPAAGHLDDRQVVGEA